MRFLILILLSFVFLVAPGLHSGATQQDGKAQIANMRRPFDGVWEFQSGRCSGPDGRPKFPLSKFVIINRGDYSYWIINFWQGPLVKRFKMTLDPGGLIGAVDFVNVSDNRTIRGLYEAAGDECKISWNMEGKTLRRPARLLPVPEDCLLHIFKRVVKEETSGSATVQMDQSLNGIWQTTLFEADGAIFEKKDFNHSFEEKEVALYIQGNLGILAKREKHDLKVSMLHLERKPKKGEDALDITFPDNSLASAIYALGADRLSLCWSFGGPRPDQFLTKKDDGRTLIRLIRIDKQPERGTK